MNPWPTKNLGEVCEIISPGIKKFEGSKKYVATADVDFDKIVNFTEITYKNRPSRANIEVKENDILVARMAETKKFLIADKNLQDNYIFSTGFAVLRAKDELTASYLFYFLTTKNFNLQKDKLAVGATQKAINNPALKKIKIPLLPLKIQQKIVERLDAIRKAQELNDKQIELAEELFQSLLHRELDPKGKNWEVRKIKECLRSCQYGISLKMNSQKIGYPILRINNLSNGEIDTSDIKYVEINREEFEKYKLEKGDILFNRVNSYDLVGKTSIFNLEDNYVFASYLIRLKTNSKLLLGEFLNYFLNSNPGQRAIKSKARRAVSQANVNARELESIKIPLPPLETQQKIVEKLSAVQEYKKKLLERKQKLQELFESVLDKSFKGELAE
jgi:type I restriction enzyme S subunit